ncbi:ScbR family autoregulator-binding transcription factor [Streptomyces rimosus]|uniref:ScbR family autoregulator-binding transcription factor n=1 Tax=Streptomyces rimosus TaxID=1927 RepID=UPI0037976053
MTKETMQQVHERAAATREKILWAASEVFDAYGYSGASISKILTRAGITPGALYFHFSGKQCLAHAVMLGQGDGLKLPGGEDGLQRLIDINLYLAGELQTNALLRAGVRLAVEQGEFGAPDDAPYQYWVRLFASQLLAAKEKGELLPDVDVQELAWTLVSSYSGTQLLSQIATGRTDLYARLVALWRYLLPGIATPAARSRVTFSSQWDCPAA